MEVKRDILWRVYLSFLGIVILSLLILGRVFYIQNFEGKYWIDQAKAQQQKYVPIEAERGTIFSEDGSMLSTSVPRFDIYIDFMAEGLRVKGGKAFKENIDSLSIALAGFFRNKSSAEYKKILQQEYRKKNRYFLLKRDLSFEEYKKFRELPFIRLGKNKSGFIPEVRSVRLNPFGLLANRTIGLARENAQNVGLERTYDSLLKGESGKKLVRFIGGGVFVPVEGSEIDPENGKDLWTTLDVNIQDIAENALLKVLKENECEQGVCIVMEVKTGKIKAVANLKKRKAGEYGEDLNFAILASEPGSTFKLATLLALLEDKYVRLDNRVNLEGGKWLVNGRTVYDSEQHGLNEVSVKEAFEHSSNVGMAKLVTAHYSSNPEQFISHLRKLRLDQRSGVNLTGETAPVIKSPKSRTWSATSLPWMAFGYEVLINPLQTLMLYNAIGNDGKMMRPYLVNAVQENGILVRKYEPEVLNEGICSESTLSQLKACLEGVCAEEGGTGYALFKGAPYKVAGKTGTALVANGNRGYSDHIYQSSFAGYFPVNDPQYSCIVVIKNKPFAKKYYGAVIAGPVFKEIADKLYAMNVDRNSGLMDYAMRPDSMKYFYAGASGDMRSVMQSLSLSFTDSIYKNEWSRMYSVNYQPVLYGQSIQDKKMPDVRGMGLKDALFLLENMNLKVSVKGKGKVKSQSIQPGIPVGSKENILIELN